MTIFKQIIDKKIKTDIIYEQLNLIVIRDINPQAKVHLLIIPKKEIPTINDLEDEDRGLLADMFFVAKKIAKDMWIEKWYKLNFNVWKEWWQEIMHLHLHLLSNI
jgi:histidine triad (HIT) family protein